MAPATRERIALTMAEANGCDYCLSAHTYTGTKFAKLDESEIEANRRGTSNDPKAAAAVEFARRSRLGSTQRSRKGPRRRLQRCGNSRDHRACRAEHQRYTNKELINVPSAASPFQ
ncbi:carboxymuconolactone decarboxylase family protein [Rhizobium laguerreae]|uniref:carboxymuconolactone decarboxylase family protein n=1 Tax=Rhizobium laguerreae TaxID=1076926 RepID=UPI0035E40894